MCQSPCAIDGADEPCVVVAFASSFAVEVDDDDVLPCLLVEFLPHEAMEASLVLAWRHASASDLAVREAIAEQLVYRVAFGGVLDVSIAFPSVERPVVVVAINIVHDDDSMIVVGSHLVLFNIIDLVHPSGETTIMVHGAHNWQMSLSSTKVASVIASIVRRTVLARSCVTYERFEAGVVSAG